MTGDDLTSARGGRRGGSTRSACAATWARRCASHSPPCTLSGAAETPVLTGALPDQSALYGMLAEIEALGLELIEVRRVG
jgi:hypothetical protein